MDGKDFREQHSENDILPRAPLGNLVVSKTLLLCHTFSESSSRKRRRALPRLALGKDMQTVSCHVGHAVLLVRRIAESRSRQRYRHFFQKYLASYLKLLLINVTSGTTCQEERTHTEKKIGCGIYFAECRMAALGNVRSN